MLHATGLGPLNSFLLVLHLNVVLNKKCDVRDVHLLSSLRGRHSKAKEKVKEFEHVNFSITQPTNPHLTPPPPPPCHCASTSNSLIIIIIIIIIINLNLYTKSYHFYMVFLGIVFKIRLKYSKELLDDKVKKTKTYIIIRVTMSHLPRRLWFTYNSFFVNNL